MMQRATVRYACVADGISGENGHRFIFKKQSAISRCLFRWRGIGTVSISRLKTPSQRNRFPLGAQIGSALSELQSAPTSIAQIHINITLTSIPRHEESWVQSPLPSYHVTVVNM